MDETTAAIATPFASPSPRRSYASSPDRRASMFVVRSSFFIHPLPLPLPPFSLSFPPPASLALSLECFCSSSYQNTLFALRLAAAAAATTRCDFGVLAAVASTSARLSAPREVQRWPRR